MTPSIAIESFDAKYIDYGEDGRTRSWQTCRVVGVSTGPCPELVVLVDYPDGTIGVAQFIEVYDEDAEMPPERRH